MENCIKCSEFDAETKQKMSELFHEDEISFLSMNLAALVYRLQVAFRKQDPNNGTTVSLKAKMGIKKEMDFVSTITGKFFISMTDEKKSAIMDSLKKVGIFVDMKHGKCPHQGASK